MSLSIVFPLLLIFEAPRKNSKLVEKREVFPTSNQETEKEKEREREANECTTTEAPKMRDTPFIDYRIDN